MIAGWAVDDDKVVAVFFYLAREDSSVDGFDFDVNVGGVGVFFEGVVGVFDPFGGGALFGVGVEDVDGVSTVGGDGGEVDCAGGFSGSAFGVEAGNYGHGCSF